MSFLISFGNKPTRETEKTFTFDEFLQVNTREIPFSEASFLQEFCRLWAAGNELFEVSTSGSTGKPKRIQIPREKMICSAEMTASALQLSEGTNALLCMNPRFIGGLMMLVRSLHLGWHLYVCEASGNVFDNFPAEQKLDFIALVPLQLQKLLDDPRLQNSWLMQPSGLIIGGAPVSPSLEKRLQVIKAKAFSTYGMTETVSHIALRPLNGSNSPYEALPGVKVSQDERGCLVIESPTGFREKLFTNDLVSMENDRQFRILGRADFVINSGGIKLNPESLERKFAASAEALGFEIFAFSSIEDERLGRKPVFTAEENRCSDKKNSFFWEEVEKVFTAYERPWLLFIIPEIPKTESGKIRRPALEELLKRLKPTSVRP